MKAVFERLDNNKTRCGLCNHRCAVGEGKRGICGVRENREGNLEPLNYGRLVARNVDPIEKKPLFHLLPGSLSYSIASAGCNFTCLFCQNAGISQVPPNFSGMIPGESCSPEDIVEDAIRENCRSIAYTYTEPTVYFELACDTARVAREKGLLNVFVTNGYMTSEALDTISPLLDAANVDLKAFTEDFYRRYCGARLEPVKETLVGMKKQGIHVEVTTLLIPGLNDAPDELEKLAVFLATSLGSETPWHISRFHPTYRMTDRPPTPLKTLSDARRIGFRAGLKYVYTGNVPGEPGENTSCHACGKLLIERFRFRVRRNLVRGGICSHCGAKIEGIFPPEEKGEG
jgi:pyruvate formate lyase activating enzyme